MTLDEVAYAESWWRFRREGGLVQTEVPPSDHSATELDAIDSWIESMSSSTESLARLIEVLARCAPNESDLPFIGTWVLEDADMDRAGSPKDALTAADLSDDVREAIRSGYLPWSEFQ